MFFKVEEGGVYGDGLESAPRTERLMASAHGSGAGGARDGKTYLHQRINGQDGAVGVKVEAKSQAGGVAQRTEVFYAFPADFLFVNVIPVVEGRGEEAGLHALTMRMSCFCVAYWEWMMRCRASGRGARR